MNDRIIRLTVDICSAFVTHNHLRAEELPDLIATAHKALALIDKPSDVAASKPKPAVDLSWQKTIRPEFLISLLDGKPYKTLRRHLSMRGLTPDAYRERYALPRNYPMVAAAYSERRSTLARAFGLGQQKRKRNVKAGTADQALSHEAGIGTDTAPA